MLVVEVAVIKDVCCSCSSKCVSSSFSKSMTSSCSSSNNSRKGTSNRSSYIEVVIMEILGRSSSKFSSTGRNRSISGSKSSCCSSGSFSSISSIWSS